MLDTMPRRSERSVRPVRRRRGLVVLVTLLLVVMGLAVAAGTFYRYATGASGPQEEVVFTIPEGATGTEVASLLEREGVIRSAFAFRLVGKVQGSSMEFAAGDYELTTNMDAREVLAALERGPLLEDGTEATFAEGLRIEQIAVRAEEQLGIAGAAFLKEARSGKYALPPFLPEGTSSVEGFLFPSTYEFDPDTTAAGVIERLLAQFEEEAADLPWENAERLGLSPYEIVVVASLIEREARFPEDRRNISAVVHNRIAKGMRLEIDATVQYALGDWEPILQSDREVDSPYNTYRIDGLPPGPIASPGRAALQAALSPADVDYLYYVVIDAEGHHAFTASYEEFLRLVDQYQG
jgi:UPF0755 protein